MTTSAAAEIRDRLTASRQRVMAVHSNAGDDRAEALEAALLALADEWRADAAFITERKARGWKTAADQLVQAASRVAGFALGLARDKPVPVAVAPANDDVMAYLTGETNVYEPVSASIAVPPVQRYATAEFSAGIETIVESPFLSPAPPGSNRPAVGRLSFADLEDLATSVYVSAPRDHLSHSAVERYERCGTSLLLSDASRRNGVGVERPAWSRIGGSAFHYAVETIELAQLESPGEVIPVEAVWSTSLDRSINEAAEAVRGSGYEPQSTWHVANSGREGADWWRVEGLNMLRMYVRHHDADWRAVHTLLRLPDAAGHPVPVLEYGFTTTLLTRRGDITDEGFIDAAWVAHNATGAVATIDIVDYKTGKSEPSDSLQLRGYAVALRERLPENFALPVRGCYWLARKGIYTTPVTIDDAAARAEIAYRYGVAQRGISAHVFPVQVSSFCSSCSMLDYCPTRS